MATEDLTTTTTNEKTFSTTTDALPLSCRSKASSTVTASSTTLASPRSEKRQNNNQEKRDPTVTIIIITIAYSNNNSVTNTISNNSRLTHRTITAIITKTSKTNKLKKRVEVYTPKTKNTVVAWLSENGLDSYLLIALGHTRTLAVVEKVLPVLVVAVLLIKQLFVLILLQGFLQLALSLSPLSHPAFCTVDSKNKTVLTGRRVPLLLRDRN